MDWIKSKEILITGGTGSLGKALVNRLIEIVENDTEAIPKGIRIYSRDELKQWEMKKDLENRGYLEKIPIAFLVGDVRDRKRLELATKGVDILVHCAALKQVPACEDNPLEAIQTNVIGAQNVLYAALENKIQKVMAISTDKAVYPINLYGATKLCAEKLFVQGNTYSGNRYPKFSCCRYGNVLGSRGSVIPLFKKQYSENKFVTITNPNMTRFWITLPQVTYFILQSIGEMKGGEIFVPKMPSASILTILEAVIPDIDENRIKYCGIRPGEKLHEILITMEESIRIIEGKKRFKIMLKEQLPAKGFEYRSNNNQNWLTCEEIRKMI